MKTCDLGQGRTLTYTDSTEGPVLVLLHAFPLDREMWRPQLVPLGGKARVLALDLPGFGGSKPFPFTVDSAADAVAEVLTKAGVPGRVVVGGLSMGGYIAMAFARRHPDRLGGLILADTKSDPDDDAAKQNRDKLIALVKSDGPEAVAQQMLPKVLADQTRASRPDVVEAVRGLMLRQTPEAISNALAAMRDRPDAGPGLDNLTAPTLVIVGEQDTVTPPVAATAISGRVWGSKVVTIPNAGHLSNLENPDAFNAAVLEFLATVPA